jgi:signal transduction histidine kinase
MRFVSCSRPWIITLLFLLYSTSSGLGQTSYLLTDTSVVHRIDAQTGVFIDSTRNLSFDEVVKQKFRTSGGNLRFGYVWGAIWLKVVTRTPNPGNRWYLEIPAPFLEYVDFYQQDTHGQWRRSEAGYYRPHSASEISHTGYVVPLRFAADSLSTVYVRITGQSPKTFPLLVTEKEKFHEKVRIEDIWYGIFFGILFAMFFYNMFIFFSLKLTNYLLYSCTIVCTFVLFGTITGYGGKFVWPENPQMNFYAGRFSMGVLTVFLAIFTVRFLEVKKYTRVMYYVLLSLIPLAVIASILVVTETWSSASNNLISLSTFVYMTTGVICRIKGNKTAGYYIAAWSIYMMGGLALTLRNSGFFDFNFWTTHFAEIGAALETTIIALALGDRYRRYKEEKETAQKLALQIQQEANEQLEIKVMERTEQLSRAYEELHATLETNKEQTKIIEAKNAELDAFFYNVSHDLKGPISTLLGLAYLAKTEIADSKALHFIEIQQQQVQRLNHIINGLINLTKLNHTDLEKEKINFDKMIDDCIVSFNGLPNFDNLTFEKDIDPDVDFTCEWTLLNTVMQNLIENAIKYSGERMPYVKIRVRDEAGWIHIEVEDNGLGISHEHQPKIFDMFYRATQNAQGTGLGLYILKKSVDRLNGTIELSSEPGVGSVFTIRLPAREVVS